MGNAFKFLDRCEAHDNFEKLVEKVESNYLGLNPTDGGLFQHVSTNDCELDERGSEFVRAGIVTVMSAWDVYVHALLEEAFLPVTLFCVNNGEGSLQWPGLDMIIENEKRLQQEALRSEGHVESSTEVARSDKEKVLQAHVDRVVYQRALLPVFDYEGTCCGPAMSIDEMFRQLFMDKKSLSERLIEVCGRDDYYDIRTSNDCTYHIALKLDLPSDRSAVGTLCALSFVHYILRCVLVNDVSFKKVNFPHEILLSDRNHRDVKAYYDDLREEVLKKGRDVHVSYLTLFNVTRYLRFVALLLMRAIAQWFYDLQADKKPEEKYRIWGYPPTGKSFCDEDESCTLL